MEVVCEVKLTARKPVAIEMQSKEFDTLLRLQDAEGKLLAENDGIDPGVNTNSRILFTPKEDGVYRIIAGSLIRPLQIRIHHPSFRPDESRAWDELTAVRVLAVPTWRMELPCPPGP